MSRKYMFFCSFRPFFLTCGVNNCNIGTMRIAVFIFIWLLFSMPLAWGQSVQDNRRTEEEKRDSLQPTEVQVYPLEQEPPLKQESPELLFLNELYFKKAAQFSDALKVATILLQMYDPERDFAFDLATLREKGIISRVISERAAQDALLNKGTAAYMFSQALGIKGGVWMRLFGSNPRYCLRELVFEGIMQARGVHELVSGRELVDMFTRAVYYLERTRPGQPVK